MKLSLSLLLFIFLSIAARAELTDEQRRLPLEAAPPDPKLAKIVLIAGTPSNKAGQHEYFAGCALMMDWLKQTPGVWPVLVGDGWLYNLHFAPGAKPLLAGQVPDKARSTEDAKAHAGRAEVVAWAYERANGGRSFAFTGCDLHKNWQVESQRRFVTNGILWSAKIEVPANGAAVPFSPNALAANLDAKPTPSKKAEPASTPPATQ